MLLQKSPERKRLLDLEFLVLTPQTVGLLNHSDQKYIWLSVLLHTFILKAVSGEILRDSPQDIWRHRRSGALAETLLFWNTAAGAEYGLQGAKTCSLLMSLCFVYLFFVVFCLSFDKGSKYSWVEIGCKFSLVNYCVFLQSCMLECYFAPSTSVNILKLNFLSKGIHRI